MKQIIWMIGFVLMMSLAAADVALQLDESGYNRPDNVQLGVTCAGFNATVEITNAETPARLVYITAGRGSWSALYNTLSDASNGRYEAVARCQDGTNATVPFCVGADGCLTAGNDNRPPGIGDGSGGDTNRGTSGGTAGDNSDGDNGGNSNNNDNSGSPSGGGGGGSRCTPRWSCSTWSFCGENAEQTRECVDTKCRRSPRIETRDCSSCEESWICSAWSECRADQQRRQCFDEHNCGTFLRQPDEQKRCDAPEAGVAPTRVSSEPFFTATPASSFNQPSSTTRLPVTTQPKFWQKYQSLLIIAGIGIVVLGLLVTAIILVHKHHVLTKAGNPNLTEWVKKARRAGKSEAYIVKALEGQGWDEVKIKGALGK